MKKAKVLHLSVDKRNILDFIFLIGRLLVHPDIKLTSHNGRWHCSLNQLSVANFAQNSI